MSRPKSKPVTVDGLKYGMGSGEIISRSCKDREHDKGHETYRVKDIHKVDAVTFEVNHCFAFFSANEARQVLGSLAHAGYRQWGGDWLRSVQASLEQMEERP